MQLLKKGKKMICALSAGILNGLLGTGGGIPLWFAISKQEDKRKAFATASTGILILSLVSVLLYLPSGTTFTTPPIFLWSSIFGGAFGAWLLNRIPLLLLRILFAFLLIGAGLFSIIRTVSHGVFA